jgi:DNA-binding transcriptional ArsR family regulator
MNDATRQRMAEAFAALGNEERLRIVERLLEGKTECREILCASSLSQPAISYHLRKLERAGILVREKTGTRACYRLSRPLARWLRSLVKEDGWLSM